MLRYSEIPHDFSTESLRYAELGEEQTYRTLSDDSPPSESSSSAGGSASGGPHNQSAESSAPLIAGGDAKHRSAKSNDSTLKRGSTAQRQRKNSAACAATADRVDGKAQPQLTQSISGGYYNYSLGHAPSNKTQSLPLNVSANGLDAFALSALRISPDELAAQITLLDLPDFRAIQPDELTSCAWTCKKSKHLVAPNIVAFTRRFNHTSFWTVQEILSAALPKQRAEIMAHFIKVAKRLFELNNLHSLFAIVSAMQTASIFRLQRTWACLSRKDRGTFERLADVFNDTGNWTNLREHLESLRLPCIPYLGLFLTDLVYIDLAHPAHPSGGLESEQRRNQMNNILRIISSYQGSDYGHLVAVPRTQKFLLSIRYIEELQNIFEDDQYKMSMKLEPPPPPATSTQSSSATASSKEQQVNQSALESAVAALATLNLSPTKTASGIAAGSMRLTASASKFIPGHRKCRSLGTKFRSTSLPRNFHQKCNCAAATTSALMATSALGGACHIAPTTTTTQPPPMCICRIFNKVAPSGNGDALAAAVAAHATVLQLQHQQHSRHLLDDSVLEDRPACCGGGGSSATASIATTSGFGSDACSTGSSEEGVLDILHTHAHHHHHLHHHHHHQQQQQQQPHAHAHHTHQCVHGADGGIGGGSVLHSPLTDLHTVRQLFQQQQCAGQHGFQGCVRRKTLLKDGRKPAVASWQRYWLQLWSNSLVYFPPKSFKGSERSDFKREPCKVCALDGWSAQQLLDSHAPQQVNTFQLINTKLGTVYKFRTSTPELSAQWLEALRREGRSRSVGQLSHGGEATAAPQPVNLMTFE